MIDFSGPTMGTRYTVRCVASPDRLAELRTLVERRLTEINRRLSTYDPGSELSRFNAHNGLGWFPVSDETARVARRGLVFARQSGGAFDPTVGPLVDLWGFGPAGPRDAPPSDAEVAAALDHVGHTRFDARRSPAALRKSSPRVMVDLSAIVPGYAADRVADLLGEAGVEHALVDLGGELVGRGRKPDGAPWSVGVAPPPGGGAALAATVELANRAVSTSGDWRKAFRHGGRLYTHTLDPRTGRPVTRSAMMVTVLAPTGIEADALSTTLSVLGPEAGPPWAAEQGVAARFVVREGRGYRVEATPWWPGAAAPRKSGG